MGWREGRDRAKEIGEAVAKYQDGQEYENGKSLFRVKKSKQQSVMRKENVGSGFGVSYY